MFRKKSVSSPPGSAPSQLEVVLRNKLSNKAERAAFFTHPELGNSLRCLQAIFEFEAEFYSYDKKLKSLHARKLLVTFVESGAIYEIASISKETRAKTLWSSAAAVSADLFSGLKLQLLDEVVAGGLVLGETPRIIAVLDDNAMVRFAIQNLLPSRLQAHASSFVMGQNRHECESFVDQIVLQQVDLAIVDENLEFEDEGFVEFGHNIGRKARERGFKGCLILHTTLPESAFPADQLLAFNGFVEKCDGKQFAEMVNRIWLKFRALKQ